MEGENENYSEKYSKWRTEESDLGIVRRIRWLESGEAQESNLLHNYVHVGVIFKCIVELDDIFMAC